TPATPRNPCRPCQARGGHSAGDEGAGRDVGMTGSVQTVKLVEVADLNPRLRDSLDRDAPVSFVPMAAVIAETGSTTIGEERRYGEVSKGYTPFLNGDVLVAKITPCFENGKI